MVPGLLELVMLAESPKGRPQGVPDRFIMASPLVSLPPVMIDKMTTGYGVAQQTARAKGLQGRMLWVDATANLDRINSEDKIIALADRAARIGFNTVVLDVKPIVGYTLYPSAYTDKLEFWKGQTLPKDFDPVPFLIREGKKRGLSVFVSMNAFSEGHRMAKEQEGKPDSPFGKAGPGYDKPSEQTVQYVPIPFVKFGQQLHEVEPTLNPTEIKEDCIGIYTTTPSVTGPSVLINPQGFVVFKTGVGIPEGHKLLVATGKATEFLRIWALPGRKLELITYPKFQRSSEVQNQIPLMMNPTDYRVRQRVINYAREVATKYDIDGLLFDDRLRFGGVDADFSVTTREAFEKHVKAKLNWPNDVFTFTYTWNLDRGVRPGKYWDRWWTWRAKQLQTWVISARKAVKEARPDVQFGIYAGSWYGEYTKWGANYARPGTRTPFSSVSDSYSNTGFADQLDVFVAGCYYKVPTIAEALFQGAAEGRTVEAGASLANRVIHDQAWTYAGVMLQDFFQDPAGLEPALQAACAASQGVMVFDLSHEFDKFEEILTRAFRFKAKAPHQVPGLLTEVRQLLVKREQLGTKEPPIFVRPGAPGVGH